MSTPNRSTYVKATLVARAPTTSTYNVHGGLAAFKSSNATTSLPIFAFMSRSNLIAATSAARPSSVRKISRNTSKHTQMTPCCRSRMVVQMDRMVKQMEATQVVCRTKVRDSQQIPDFLCCWHLCHHTLPHS